MHESRNDAGAGLSFDERAYLFANPDVAAAVRRGEIASGEEHYRHFGRAEERPLRLMPIDGAKYLEVNPDVAEAVRRGEFRDARHHYCSTGWREDRCLARREIALETGVARSLSFQTPSHPLTAISVRFATGGGVLEGELELRLHRFAGPLVAGARSAPEPPARRATVDLRHIYDGELLDWLFAPVAGPPGGWRVDFELLRLSSDRAPALVAHLRGRQPAVAAGQVLLPLPLDEGWSIDFIPHGAPLHAPPPRGLCYNAVTRCNLNCTHCISRVTRGRVRRLSGAEQGRFLPFLRQAGLPNGIISDYAGDPFFTETTEGGVLDLLESMDANIGLTTNGNVMTPALAWRVTGPAYHHVWFSLDAARPGTYAKIRRGACSLDQVLGNLRLLVEIRRRRGGGARPLIGLNVVLMKSNVEELCELVDIALSTGVDGINGVHLIAMTDDMERESLWHHQPLYNAVRARALAHAAEQGVKLALPPPFRDRPPAGGHRVCHDAWTIVSVLGNGDVQACCMPESVMGNLGEHSLEEIWNGPIYRALRARVNSDNPPEACRHCPMVRLAHNSSSYLYNRPRRRLRLFRDELMAPAPDTPADEGGPPLLPPPVLPSMLPA